MPGRAEPREGPDDAAVIIGPLAGLRSACTAAPPWGTSSNTPTGRGSPVSPTVHLVNPTRQPAASRASRSFRLGPRNGSATSTRPPGARFVSKMCRRCGRNSSPYRMSEPMTQSYALGIDPRRPVGQAVLDRRAVPLGVKPADSHRPLLPVGLHDPGPERRGDDAGQSGPGPQLQHAPPAELGRPGGDLVGQGDGGRPEDDAVRQPPRQLGKVTGLIRDGDNGPGVQDSPLAPADGQTALPEREVAGGRLHDGARYAPPLGGRSRRSASDSPITPSLGSESPAQT